MHSEYQALQQAITTASLRQRPDLHVTLARSASEVREAQRLRWQVFAEELGARLSSREPGVDQDIYDPHCEHLIVRDEARGGIVVGTYRIFSPEAAKLVGAYYSESEFDLVRLRNVRSGLVTGRDTICHQICRRKARREICPWESCKGGSRKESRLYGIE